MVVYTPEQRWDKCDCDRLTEDADFGKKKIIFSDKDYFDLGGYANKQTCRIWGTENPQVQPTHPKRITVWSGFQSTGIIGSFFFENEQREDVVVNGYRYRAMLNEFLFTKIEVEDIGNIWFQQEGRRADVVWPPRQCNLAPSDYYLWRTVKDNCYADKPETIDSLRYNIHEAIGEIQLHTIDSVLKNGTDRVGYCMACRVRHLN